MTNNATPTVKTLMIQKIHVEKQGVICRSLQVRMYFSVQVN